MTSPQFTPRSARPLTRETYQQAADNWSRMCSQLDDYAIAGNVAGITRMLSRLHHSVRALRERHASAVPCMETLQRTDGTIDEYTS